MARFYEYIYELLGSLYFQSLWMYGLVMRQSTVIHPRKSSWASNHHQLKLEKFNVVSAHQSILFMELCMDQASKLGSSQAPKLSWFYAKIQTWLQFIILSKVTTIFACEHSYPEYSLTSSYHGSILNFDQAELNSDDATFIIVISALLFANIDNVRRTYKYHFYATALRKSSTYRIMTTIFLGKKIPQKKHKKKAEGITLMA